ncbi:signal peptidase II [Janibacter limosus]|uniref:Signal peptidase II n=1 Tax=Janibacter limosus TaxID=53458 RepID=A0AC61U4P5_9MICO|nr:signal peptidase II [Janibacter limosus]UUZ44981.1 signal peptidase II [Janibacter limosus]
MRARTKRALVFVVAVLAATVDLVAKAASETRLADSTVDLGVLQLRLGYNSGMAFSMGDQLPVSVIVTITATISIAPAAYAWHRAPHAGRVERIAGGAVLGGAVANVIDRARDGVVTDYLHTGWWPTFNLADTFPGRRLHRDRRAPRPPRAHRERRRQVDSRPPLQYGRRGPLTDSRGRPRYRAEVRLQQAATGSAITGRDLIATTVHRRNVEERPDQLDQSCDHRAQPFSSAKSPLNNSPRP